MFVQLPGRNPDVMVCSKPYDGIAPWNTHLRTDSVNLCWDVDSQQMHS